MWSIKTFKEALKDNIIDCLYNITPRSPVCFPHSGILQGVVIYAESSARELLCANWNNSDSSHTIKWKRKGWVNNSS